MGTIINEEKINNVCIAGNKINGFAKNGDVVYKVTSYFLLEWTDVEDKEHNENITNEDDLRSRISSISNNLKLCKISSVGKIKISYTNYMFSGCSSLTTLDLSNFDTSNTTQMVGMFSGCSSLKTLDLLNFDTSNVTYMLEMFSGCSSLTTLDLSNFDTSNVNDMHNMFSGCSSLTTLDLSNFDTSNVNNMDKMFSGCSSLTTLDLSNFEAHYPVRIFSLFLNCTSLKLLNMSNFYFSNSKYDKFIFYNIPVDCLITVRTIIDKDFVLKQRNDLTNVQIKS